MEKKQSVIDNIICPRVNMRLACSNCGYPASEALFGDESEMAHNDWITIPHIPCKEELIIEDNPVPSLDELANNIIEMFGQPNWVKPKLLNLLKTNLQNGVETDNEQPKCFYCGKNATYIVGHTNSPIIVCSLHRKVYSQWVIDKVI